MAVEERSRRAKAGRLDADDWVRAAGAQLADVGIDGVRVELIAKRLAITKGSFYWHFKDRDALLAAIIHEWRRSATMVIIESLEKSSASPSEKLKRLFEIPFKRTLHDDVGRAIRLWARTDMRAAEAIEEIDGLRLRYIGGLYEQLGFTREDAQAYAILAYGYTRTGTKTATGLAPRIEAILTRVTDASPELGEKSSRRRGAKAESDSAPLST